MPIRSRLRWLQVCLVLLVLVAWQTDAAVSLTHRDIDSRYPRSLPDREDIFDALLDRPAKRASGFKKELASTDLLQSIFIHSYLPPIVSHFVTSQLQAFYDPLISLFEMIDSLPSSLLAKFHDRQNHFTSARSRYLTEDQEERSVATATTTSPTANIASDSTGEKVVACSGVGVAHGVEFSECLCPLDFIGDRCETHRPFTCKPHLVTPVPDCVSKSRNGVYYGDQICFLFSKLSDTPTFSFTLDCYFENTTDLYTTPPTDTEFPYPYWVYTNTSVDGQANFTFAITAVPNVTLDWIALLKVFNFNRISDLGASQTEPLTPEQILGIDTISFTLPLASYDAKYLMGGRLYFETGVYSARTYTPAGMISRAVDARFVDFNDYIPRGTPSYTTTLPGWAIFLIIFAVFAALLIILKVSLIAWKRYKKSKKSQHEKSM